MDFRNYRESTNYEDRSAAPWYDPHKMLANVMIEMQRVIGSKKQQQLDEKQAQMDANPLPVQTPQERQADFNARVQRDPSGRGWTINRPGQISEFAPDYMDTSVVNTILKHAGIGK